MARSIAVEMERKLKFSQKRGYSTIRTTLQLEDIDNPLLNKLWNAFLVQMKDLTQFGSTPPFHRLHYAVWTEFWCRPIDEAADFGTSYSHTVFLHHLRTFFFECEWFEVFDLIEFCVPYFKSQFATEINQALEIEMSAYRLINEEIAAITSEDEIAAIETAIKVNGSTSSHLKNALNLLSDRIKPDYRNSIKESISSIEALSTSITGSKKDGFDKAMGIISEQLNFHPALKKAFVSLYGYTSDSSGIRHALTENDRVGVPKNRQL